MKILSSCMNNDLEGFNRDPIRQKSQTACDAHKTGKVP